MQWVSKGSGWCLCLFYPGKKEAPQKQFATVLKPLEPRKTRSTHSEAGHYDLNLNIDDIKHNIGLCNFALLNYCLAMKIAAMLANILLGNYPKLLFQELWTVL